MISPLLEGIFSTPLSFSRQKTRLPRPTTGRIRLMAHCGSVASARFELATGLSFDSASELLNSFGGTNKNRKSQLLEETKVPLQSVVILKRHLSFDEFHMNTRDACWSHALTTHR